MVMELRKRLEGPAYSVNTPFTKDGDIDYASLRRLLSYVIENGASSIILTYGDSLYSVLEDREIGELTKATVEIVEKRVPVVAADRQWWTKKEVEFAEYCISIGADALMVLPPDWAASSTVSTLIDHYAAVAKVIPVMVVTNLFVNRGMAFGLDVIKTLKEQVPNVVAIKDDFTGDFAKRAALLSKDRFTFMMGGRKEKFLEAWDYGCSAYFSTFLAINPSITRTFYNYVQNGDHVKAAELIATYEMPFFEAILSCKGGFDAGIRAATHLNDDLIGIFRRSPYATADEADISRIKQVCRSAGIL